MRPGDLTCILTIAFLRVCKDGVDNKKKKMKKPQGSLLFWWGVESRAVKGWAVKRARPSKKV